MVVVAAVLFVGVVYVALRFAQALPSQRRAHDALVATRQLIDSPAFGREVVQPLEQYLSEALPIARNIGPFANFVDHATDDDFPLNSMLPANHVPGSPLIENWRSVMNGLQAHDVRVYGLPHALLRGDASLREFVAARLAHADPALATTTKESAATEVAVVAVARQLGVSRIELNGIMFAAERAQRLRTPAGH